MTEKHTIEFIITKGEFEDASQFSKYVEASAERRKITYLEAMIDYCESKQIEPQTLAKSLTPELKKKIQREGEGLNILRKRATA